MIATDISEYSLVIHDWKDTWWLVNSSRLSMSAGYIYRIFCSPGSSSCPVCLVFLSGRINFLTCTMRNSLEWFIMAYPSLYLYFIGRHTRRYGNTRSSRDNPWYTMRKCRVNVSNNVVENTMANTINKTNVQTSDFNNF